MQSTAPRSIRALSSKIHQQLPLTNGESQRLLGLLTQSFQQQLDKHHPVRPRSRRSSQADRAAVAPSSLQTADRHVSALLSHPLLSSKLDTPFTKDTTILGTDPLKYLEQKIATGEATLPVLRSALSRLTESTAAATVHARGSYYRALKWVVSGGQLSMAEILADLETGPLVMRGLILEEHEEVIRQYLNDESIRNLNAKTWVLTQYMSALIRTRDQNAAAAELLTIIAKPVPQAAVHRAARGLMKMQLSERSDRQFSADINDALRRSIHKWSPCPVFDRAILKMCHPSSPNLRPAIALITQSENLKGYLLPSAHVLKFCFAVAKRLLAESRNGEAESIVKIIETQFPEEVAAVIETNDANTSPQKVKKAARRQETEDHLLQQLHNLSFG